MVGLDCSRTNKLIDHTKYTLKSRNILPIKQTRDQSERGSKLSTPKKVSFAGLRESECAAVYSKLNSRERRGGYCGETNQQFVTKFTGNLLVAVVVAMVQWRANGWMDGRKAQNVRDRIIELARRGFCSACKQASMSLSHSSQETSSRTAPKHNSLLAIRPLLCKKNTRGKQDFIKSSFLAAFLPVPLISPLLVFFFFYLCC